MSEFSCPVVRVKIEPHPNADAIEIARVGDFQSIVKKGQFNDGDLGIYIPESAVLPQWLLMDMGFWNETQAKGGLHGSKGDRVKAIKLRGVLSQGLVLTGVMEQPYGDAPVTTLSVPNDEKAMAETFYEGEDAAEFLGITKYEPALPSHMRGRALGVDTDATHKYDFENVKKNPQMFQDGDLVVITEKIHGTLLQVGVVPSGKANERFYEGRVIITSKGMGGRGIILDHNDETNLYAQAAKKWGLLDSALRVLGPIADRENKPAFIFGEVFGVTPSGAGIQDLTYTGVELDYRAFDICVGNRGLDKFMPWDEFNRLVEEMGIWRVPDLYVGPFSKEKMLELTDGKTTLLPPNNVGHIREGVVVKSYNEDRDPRYVCQRKIAKSISEAYLLRKGNVSEYQ